MTADSAVAQAPVEAADRPGRQLRPAAWSAFLVVAGVFGVVFAVLVPPFWGHDEITQFGRAYQVSRGDLLPVEIDDARGPAWGGDVPLSVDLLMGYALHDYSTKDPFTHTDRADEPAPLVARREAYPVLWREAVTREQKEIWFTNTAAYSPVPYLPQTLGIHVAEALDGNVGQLVLAPRLAALLSYLAIVGYGLWALRRSRVQWLMFTIAVLPISLFQAGTVTADTVTNGLALLASALLLKALFLNRRLTRPELAALLVSAILLPLCKPTYVLLAMLVVLVPARATGLGRLRWLPWLCAGIGAAGFGAWTTISAPTTSGMGLMRTSWQWHEVRPADQLNGMLTDPFGFAGTFGESILRRDQEWFSQFFGQLGFAYVDVPATSIVAFLLALAIAAGVADRMRTPSNRVTTVVLLAILATVAMIFVTLYMSFSPVGYYIIDGVQGRYFVPIAVPAFAVVLRWVRVRLAGESGPPGLRGPAIAIVGASVAGLTMAVLEYNLMVWG